MHWFESIAFWALFSKTTTKEPFVLDQSALSMFFYELGGGKSRLICKTSKDLILSQIDS